MGEIQIVSSGSRDGWTERTDPPGEIPSAWRELTTFESADGVFSTGLWEREPDTWPFAREHDEVAVILRGSADIETDDGQTLHIGQGDVFITPKGSKGVWHVRETIVKFYAIYGA
jgi:uncharacterized protein